MTCTECIASRAETAAWKRIATDLQHRLDAARREREHLEADMARARPRLLREDG